MKSKINNLKKMILKAAYIADEGHIASSFSILDILWVLYGQVLDIERIKSGDNKRDVFILSKGHASLALYAILVEKDFISESEMLNVCKFNSILGGHPDCNKAPGVEASTGSLGHGFPMSIGVALAHKIQNIPNRVYTLIGDGECNEGTIWESALLASHHKLDNLSCIVDYNHSTDRALSMGNIADKFSSFGWESKIIDGHDHKQIYEAFIRIKMNKPQAIIAETIKGKGCICMENNPQWHHKAPSESELSEMLEELDNA